MRTVNIYTAMMKIPKQRWLQHLLFWLLAFYILLRIFAGSAGIEKIDVIYTLILTPTFILSGINSSTLNLALPIACFDPGSMKFAVYGPVNA